MKVVICAALLLLVAGFAQAQSSSAHSTSKPVVVAIKDAQAQNVGTATLESDPKGVKITFDVKNMPPGQHSVHIHQNAKCDPPDFKSAGAHFGAAGEHEHGAMPAGDIPDFALFLGPDGTAHVSTVAPNVTLGSDDHSVFSNGGTSIVIHAVVSNTAGGAPPRIACGVIVKPE
jgi:superoxide dismutase, Cu-Zn family